MATKKPEDDFKLDDLNADVPEAAAPPKEGERKFDEAGTVGGAIVDTLSLGHSDDIIGFLKRLGLATDQAATQTTKQAMAENPKSAALGTGLALALPVGAVEAGLGTAARGGAGLISKAASNVVPKALGGEGALAGGARAALAELGVGEAMEAGKAATGGGPADWTAPLYSAAFAGPLAALGGAAARGPGRDIRKAVGPVPEGTALPASRADPTGTIPNVAQTAPEALQQAGLGQQAADAEALLRRTLGGQAPTMPGRDAAFAGGRATREGASTAAEDAMIAAGGKDVLSPFSASPDLQDIHFQSAGQRTPGDASLFGYAQTLEEAQRRAGANPALGGQIDTALGALQGQGRPEVGDLFRAHGAEKQFDEFAGGFGVTPPAAPAGGSGIPGRLASGAVDILSDLIPGGGVVRAGARLLGQHALDKVLAGMPASVPKNADTIRQILMDPTQFAGILKPEEIAELTKLATARGLGATAAGTGLANSVTSEQGEREKRIKREFGR